MILNDRWNGADDPFEGDRELVLRHLPAGARVRSARARVVPTSIGQAPFVETLRFPDSGAPGAGSGDRGITRATVGNAAVEIDFHARRTLAGIDGSGLGNAILTVDLGGGYVLVGASGAVVGPGQPAFPLAGDSPPLPGLTVARFRLDAAGGSAPQVSAVRVKSVPSNLTLSLPGRPALWFHAGELAQPETTPDFAAVLQAFLDGKATVENGYYVLPILLHSDSIARLQVELEVEYFLQASVLPDGLGEAMLPFALDGLPQAGTAELAVALPADARVVPGDTGSPASRAKGSFAGTRVALGPTADVTPAGTVDVAAGSSPAQPLAGIVPEGDLEIVAVDLRLAATTRSAKLQLDLREDDDGKPGAASLLPAPVSFSLDRASGGLTPWTSVALPSPFQFQEPREWTGWLILQALDGEALWSVSAAVPTAQGVRGLEQTTDGGFSWRQAALAPPGPAALAGLFRLRSRPATFTMPIELAVGNGTSARRVSLARFTPQGRVDLSLDLPEVAEGFNQALAPAAAAACPVGELLADGDFSSWVRTGSQLGLPHRLSLSRTAETVFQTSRIAAGPDGRQAFVVSSSSNSSSSNSSSSQQSLLFQALDLDSETVAWQATGAGSAPVGLAVRSDGSRAYAALAGGAVWILDLAERRSLGVLPSLSAATPPLAALALSPDGSRLYLAVEASTEGIGEGSVVAYDTAQLEAAVAGGPPPTPLASATPFPWHPVDLAVAPDGSRVYALVQGTGTHVGQADLLAFDPDSLAFDATLPSLFPSSAPAPKALALTPDGAMAVVAADAQVSLVRLQERAVLASISGPATATAVAVEPDGARAFVASAEGVTTLDLARRAIVVPSVTTGPTTGLAVTPQGDRILAAVPGAAVVEVIPIGLAISAEWALTAGQVRPGTLPSGTPIALLGEPDTPNGTAAATGPSAISQVVPIMTGCTYGLRFQGLATVADAVAELLWRGADGAVVRTDPVPIAVAAKLSLHQASFVAPAGAMAVEVRFTAPAGTADLAQASLRADGGALGDLAGGATAWERNPPSPTAGFALTETAEGTRLRNVSPREVTLSQTVPATAGAAFAFELQGQAVAVPGAPASAPTPGVELHWQTARGIEVAPATLLPVLPGSFDAQAAAGTVPPRAEQAEVRLVVPSGAALAVRAVDLRFPAAVRLPVTFVAQAPGELALLDWRVTYDRVPAPPPPIPAGGLPAPTPPPQPARGGPPGSSPCPCCGDARPAANASPAQTLAGRPVTTGTCLGCGATRLDFGGPAVAGAPTAPLPAAAPAPPAATRQLVVAKNTPTRNLTEVSGIGTARARRLQAIGIGSLAELATASPTALKQALPGVSVAAAGRFVLQARELLRS